MKIASVIAACNKQPSLEMTIVHTGQHYDVNMSKVMFEDLCLPEPDHNLGIQGGNIGSQTGRIMVAFEELLPTIAPDLVLVVGDVNSTLAAAYVAKQHHIPVAHVEAGLRSNDRTMPEEINRILTDSISDLLFVSEPSGVANLQQEGVPDEHVFHVGNVMIDTLMRFKKQASNSRILETLNLTPKKYGVITLHRPATVDDPETLSGVIDALVTISQKIPLIWPMHPRTASKMSEQFPESHDVSIIEPLGYLDFLQLTSNSKIILTDSGGIQEEATVLGVPCLTLRDNTERPCTLASGMNQLVGTDPEVILQKFEEIFDLEETSHSLPETWDGCTGERIASILAGFDGCIPTRSSNSATFSTQ